MHLPADDVRGLRLPCAHAQPLQSRMQCNHVCCFTVGPLNREAFTLHGLWVNYDTGKYPQFCTHDAFDADEVCTWPRTSSPCIAFAGTGGRLRLAACDWRLLIAGAGMDG